MRVARVRAHARKGRPVRAHLRRVRGFVPAGGDPVSRPARGRVDVRQPDAPRGIAIPGIPAGPATNMSGSY